jgi:hypothetical protein
VSWLDTIDPRLFWSALVVLWFAASWAIGTLLGRILRWGSER